ncbi:MAG: hypothetical protein R2867_32060 [Caldilineaceae bacterium]
MKNSSPNSESYTSLDATKIIGTVERLSRRVGERFPESGLYQVAKQLLTLAHQAHQRSIYVARPIYWIRIVIGLLIVFILLGIVGMVTTIAALDIVVEFNFFELIQAVEAGINDIVFLGVGIFFLVTLENRYKRGRAIRALNELRAVAHVIDMHQLTKDPEYVLRPGQATASSPERTMTAHELGRYLDYCSELLALTGKLAALYMQSFDDNVVLNSAGEIEDLTTGLSRKIWQKLMILHSYPGS